MPFCPNCGTGNPDGARFCQSCGTAIPPIAPSPPSPGGAPGAAGQAPPGYGLPGHRPPAAYGAPPRLKNPGVAAALGLLWGFGAQAFYTGQTMTAVVQFIINVLSLCPMRRFAGGGGAWFMGLAVAAVFMVDGYKVAQKVNAGSPVGPWTFF